MRQALVNLQPYNSLAMPGQAQFFAQCTSSNELDQLLLQAQSELLLVHILGGGSNVLVPEHLQGLVIQPQMQGIQVEQQTSSQLVIRVAAGVDWPQLVQYCADQGWWGLENLAAIPGKVGAAPIQNIGAYGVELADVLLRLQSCHRQSRVRKIWSHQECLFGYRDSVFKHPSQQGQWVIEWVELQLSRHPQPKLTYGPLQVYQGQGLSAKDLVQLVTDIRSRRLPDPKVLPNAGSFFHNPRVSPSLCAQLQSQWPDMPIYPAADGQKKLSAGWLIEQVGYKGKHNAWGLGMYNEHALVLVNPKRQGLAQVQSWAREVQEAVLNGFGVRLEIEPRVLGAC